MTGQSLADALATVEPRQFVVLSGYPDDTESRWHVNKAVQIGHGEMSTLAIVLQAGDASEHWITAIIQSADDEPVIDKLAAVEGEPPSGMAPEESAEDLSPEEIEVVRIEDN